MEKSGTIDIAVLGAVPQEVEPLYPWLTEAEEIEFLGERVLQGNCAGRRMLISSTGIGKVNAAVTTAALLVRYGIAQVWNIGCSGAYSEGPLQVGDVLMTLDSVIADEGVLTRNGPLSSEAIGIPILTDREGNIFDRIPLDRNALYGRIMHAAPAGIYRIAGACATAPGSGPHSLEEFSRAGGVFEPCRVPGVALRAEEAFYDTGAGDFSLVYGPSLTVSMASGDAGTAAGRYSQFNAYAENMEGSAVAQTCFRFGVSMLECRGISNAAGDRGKERWEFRTSMAHCHGIVLRLIERLRPD